MKFRRGAPKTMTDNLWAWGRGRGWEEAGSLAFGNRWAMVPLAEVAWDPCHHSSF